MTACVVLHNMIVEDERDLNLKFFMTMLAVVSNLGGTRTRFKHFKRSTKILSIEAHTHTQLRDHIIEH